jgi:hypothetical protein
MNSTNINSNSKSKSEKTKREKKRNKEKEYQLRQTKNRLKLGPFLLPRCGPSWISFYARPKEWSGEPAGVCDMWTRGIGAYLSW